MKNIRVHAFISGRVQGVGYRYSAINQAQKLGLTGWVRNTHDGRVEAVLEGDENIIEKMISWLQEGPPMSTVTDIQIQRLSYSGEFNNFSIRG